MELPIKNKFQAGQLIVELLVAFGLASIMIPAVIFGFISGTSGKVQQQQRLAATGYLREAEEATRSVRDANWSNIATNGTYHPVINGAVWSLQTGQETLGDFTRKIVISDTTPADVSQKLVTVTVSWSNILPTNLTSSFILSRWKNQSTALLTTGTLAGLGHGDWCNPNLHITPYDISGNGIGIAISSVVGATSGLNNTAFITTGNNASSFSAYDVSITDPPYPATPSASTANTYNNGKDYGLFANQNYVYVATGNVPGDSKRVVDILNPVNLGRVGFFDASSNLNAQSVVVDETGNTGYVTASTNNGSASYLMAFTAAPPVGTASQTQLWSKNLTNNAIGNKVRVAGGYAYIATNATANSLQFQVVKLSDRTIYSPPALGTGSINTAQPGVDLAILGGYAYLVTGYSAGSPDIFVIDISVPTAPKVVGSTNTFYSNTSMNPLGVATTPNNANILIVVGDGGWQYQPFNVADPTHPFLCGTPLQNPNGATKVQAVSTLREVDSDVYSYILTSNGSAQQFQAIEGGPGGGGGGNGGVFESPIFNAGHSVVFNSFAEATPPPDNPTPTGVTTAYQVAVSPDCATFNYTGNYTGAGGVIPLSLNPGVCFRYKVSFTNGGGATSASTNVLINYSP